MAVQVLTAKPDDPSSSPRSYMFKGKVQLLQLSSDLHTYVMACTLLLYNTNQ